MNTPYHGNCHCGAVQFDVNADLDTSMKCNCSFCIRRGSTLLRVDPEEFQLTSPESALGVYGNREFSDHYFCKTCGIHCFTRISRETGNAVVVNAGCLQGVDAYALTPTLFDGANKL